VVDGSNVIFNHELNSAGNEGDPMSIPSGGNFIFYDPLSSAAPCPTCSQAIQAWAAYNNPANASNNTADPTAPATWTYPATPAPGTVNTGPPNIPNNLFVTQPGGGSQQATAADLSLIGINPNATDCMTEMNNPPYWPTSAACGGNSLNSMENAWGRNTSNGASGTGDSPMMWSNVDSLKSDIINSFNNINGSHGTISVSDSAGGAGTDPSTAWVYSGNGMGANPPASGLGAYKVGLTDGQIENMGPAAANYPWANNEGSAPLETLNPSAWDLINQVLGGGNVETSCQISTLLNDITQRCKEIVPSTTQAQVVSLLQTNTPTTTMNMGVNLYICKQKPSDPTSPLIITNVPPFTANNTTVPDGGTTGSNAQSANCDSGWYGLSGGSMVGGLIDSQSPNGQNSADDNLHDQPYMEQNGTLQAEDHADFILSSGYQNLLGKLEFYQVLQGNDQFSRPN